MIHHLPLRSWFMLERKNAHVKPFVLSRLSPASEWVKVRGNGITEEAREKSSYPEARYRPWMPW